MNRLPYIPLIIAILLNLLTLLDSWGIAGIHVLNIISVIMIFVGLWSIQRLRNAKQQAAAPSPQINLVQLEQEKFLQSMRHQRHDWLNHFQVLLGYLKLQRYDVCEEYIKKVTEQTNNDSRIAGLGYPPLVAFLLTFNALHKELTLEVELPADIDLRTFAEEDNKKICEVIKAVVEIYRRNSRAEDGDPNLLVLLIQQLNNVLYVSVEFEGQLAGDACIEEIYSLVQQFGNEEGFFVEGLHNNKESIMEFYLPLTAQIEVKQ